jgi:TetR/AcrR family transcriptional regulator, transcriptional repressor for nem operon
MIKITAKQKILEATQQLMVGRGYKATTVDDIIKHAGVAKGSFYHAFKSKEDLTIAALEDYKTRGLMIIGNGPYTTIEDPVERALALLEFIEDKSSEIWQHGCLLGTVAIEVADGYPKVLQKVDQLFSEYEAALTLIFTLALRKQKIKTVSGKELSQHFMSIVEGSIIMSKAHSQSEVLALGVSHFKQYLTLLLKGKIK